MITKGTSAEARLRRKLTALEGEKERLEQAAKKVGETAAEEMTKLQEANTKLLKQVEGYRGALSEEKHKWVFVEEVDDGLKYICSDCESIFIRKVDRESYNQGTEEKIDLREEKRDLREEKIDLSETEGRNDG